MTLSVSLSPRAEAILRDQAAATGKEPTVLASELLEEAVSQRASNSSAIRVDSSAVKIADRLAPILREIWAAEPDQSQPELTGQEAEVRDLVVEKFRKQGLKL